MELIEIVVRAADIATECLVGGSNKKTAKIFTSLLLF